jgi:hypothetical protein
MSVSERAIAPLMAEPPISNEMIIQFLPFLKFSVCSHPSGGFAS